MPGTREASHAGSWYDASPATLSSQLSTFLSAVPSTLDSSPLPIPSARIIIAPHAGYTYSGPCAAWAYKSLDLRSAKRIFILGPSHTYYLRGCALTTFDRYETPFGDFVVDQETCGELRRAGGFADIPRGKDVDEHSLEMHLPYLWKRCEETFGTDEDNKFPMIVPVLVGDGTVEQEKGYGALLARWVGEEGNVFVVSSDFCHWGRRFAYRPVLRDGEVVNLDGRGSRAVLGGERELGKVVSEKVGEKAAIHEVIKGLDELAIEAAKTGSHEEFYRTVEETGNTVCGRHPIGVIMAALEVEGKAKFAFVQYQRSSLVEHPNDSSVSYVSAYAVV